MPAPSSANEFVDLVRKSGVLDEKRLDAYVEQLRAAGNLPNEPSKLAGLFVRDGVLTNFQVEQFLLGKWRRFHIGKYKVLERLGSGGMGSVYLCEHRFMRRRVAVKVLPKQKAEDTSALERFYREARAVAALDHPNIVRAYDIDQDDQLHFLVMEYVEGASLQEIVKKRGRMDVARATHYIRQAAVGLQHAHENGLVHRDIKPGNLLIDRSGTVKVLDMGLARFFNDEEDNLTKRHDENVLGTADYLAPEQALDSHGVDIRADIYSLGATFYFLLSGSTPFSEGTVAQKLIWHQTRQPKPIRSLRTDVPEGLAAVIEKMMAKDPAQRYQVPGELVEALTPWTQNAIPPPPEDEMPRLSRAAMVSGQAEPSLLMTSTPTMSPGSTGTRRADPLTAAPAARPVAAFRNTPVPPSKANLPSVPAAAKPSSSASGSTKQLPPVLENGKRDVAPPRPAEPAAAAPPPLVEPAAEEEDPPWESLAADTDDLTAQADTAPRGSSRSFRRRPGSPATLGSFRDRRYFLIAAIGGGIIAAGFLGLLLFFLLRSGKPPSSAKPAERQRDPLVVSANGEFKTLAAALSRAKTGDRIMVQSDLHERFVVPDGKQFPKDLTIEAAGDHEIVWRFPESANPATDALVKLNNVEGLRLKGFTLDGGDRAANLLAIWGICPGARFEDLHFQGFTGSALLVLNCSGESGRPVSFQHLWTTAKAPDSTAVILDAPPNLPPDVDQYLSFSDCRFEGPCKAAVRVDGPVADVEFARNRFFKCTDGFLCRGALKQVQLTLSANTFYDISGNALRFEGPPQADASKVVLTDNLFGKVGEVAHLDVLPNPDKLKQIFGDARGNVRVEGGKDGNAGVALKEVQGSGFILSVDPRKESDFLRYDRASPLSKAGADGGPVGVPPE
jgi:serine/threonine protein kinase